MKLETHYYSPNELFNWTLKPELPYQILSLGEIQIPINSEADIFDALLLKYIPPNSR